MDKKQHSLTLSQQNIILIEQVNENTAINNITAIININENFNTVVCQSVINYVIKNNDAMRLKFIKTNGNYVQEIDYFKEEIFEVVDMQNFTTLQIENYMKNYAKELLILQDKAYDFKILKYDDKKGCILMRIHHMICDAWSCSIIANQIIDNIKKIEKNELLEDKAYPSYIEHIESENEYINSDKFNSDEIFWKDYLKDISNCISLKTKNNITNKAGRYTIQLDDDISDKIKKICLDNKISSYSLFLTVFSAYISRIRKCNDFVLGTPVLNRSNFKEKQMLGMFVSTIPVRIKTNDNMKMLELAREISLDTMSLFRHQKFPYSKILENFRKESSIKSNLYNVMISYQNARADIEDENIYSADWIFNEYIEDELQIHITDMNNTGKFLIHYDYLKDIFCEYEIKLLNERLINIITQLEKNNGITLNEISVITKDENDLILNVFNNTNTKYPKNDTVIDLFEKQVERTPNNIALIYEDKKLTYKELNKLSNHLATYLVNKMDIKQNDVISIMVDKSIDHIIAILACLKCKASYLPIESELPKDRVEYMLADSNSKIILTNNLSGKNLSCKVIEIKGIIYDNEDYGNLNNSNTNYDYNSTVYIMYTSGTTGLPKGIEVSNRNIIRLVENTNFIEFKKDDIVLQTGTIGFDAITFEVWGALLHGIPLYLISKEKLLDISYFEKFLNNNNITVMWLTAPLFNNMAIYSPAMFSKLRVLLIGGDILSPKHVYQVLKYCPNLQLLNGYGPTENTTFSCCYLIDKEEQSNIPIGKPIANSKCYVVDSKSRLLPLYVEGELLVSGDGVTKGYINNLEKTNECFIQDPFSKDLRAYKTGDIGYYDITGNINFIGRRDNQVKINGYRIEIEEIKNAILKNTNIKDCYVATRLNINETNEILVIYTTYNNTSSLELKEFLRKRLPNYMIPKYLILVDDIPLNKNGKIDKNMLNELLIKDINLNHVEQQEYKGIYNEIYKIFKDILCKENISITDNFFDIGGDSLLAIKAVTAFIAHDFKVTYADFYKNPTIQQLGDFLTLPVIQESISKEIETFDYTDINNLLEDSFKNNSFENNYDIGNILITGVTGFLGAHVLDEYLKSYKGIAYCLVRDKDGIYVEERLRNRLKFFFEDKYDKEIGNRIKIICGDLENEIIIDNRNDYDIVKREAKTIIHCAANVKHFGDVSSFKKVNVLAVENMIKFCLHNSKRLIHVSTLSVSGNILETGQIQQDNIPEGTIYNERNLYVGQNLDNVYAYTKFLAEKVVLDAIIYQNLDAKIIRMGNLTGRLSDGKFQPNVEENAFANRLKSFINLSVIPDNILDFYLEFTPIDNAARALLLLAKCNNNYHIFHLFNQNHVQMEEALSAFEKIGIHLNHITKSEMTELIGMYSNSKDANDISGIILDINKNKEIDYKPNIIVKSQFTIDILKNLGFEWPIIGEQYICQYLKYLFDINFLKYYKKEEK